MTTPVRTVDETPQLEAIARAALPRFRLDPETPITLIHRRENAVFRLDPGGDEPPWVLRVHRLRYRTSTEIRSELAWMEALRTAGVRTPPVRAGADGDGVQTVAVPGAGEARDVTVLGWIEGRSLEEDGSTGAYRLVGRTSALIQQHGRAWTPPAWFRRPTWHVDALVGPRALWGDYAALAALSADQLALMHRAADRVRRRLAAFGCGPDRFGLTHGDLMPDNILVAQGVPVVIDFDDGGYGWYLYDLATLLAVKAADADYGRIREAWIEGYRTVAPLPDAHVPAIGTLVMARLLLGLGWMHTRRETVMAQQFTDMTIALACLHAERLLAEEGRTP